MLENLIYSQKKSLLTKELEAGNIPENAIAFIGDTKEIYALGLYFGGGYTKEEIDEMFILSKYEFVDLGLPSGLKWATCNVGATKPEDFGLYFAWGETQGYADVSSGKGFYWGDYKFHTNQYNPTSTTFEGVTKYNTSSSTGTVDNLTTLEQVDDAAYQSDNTCRMPTKVDFEELIANTTSIKEILNGVKGRRFTSNINGNSIFVPASGFYSNGSVGNIGADGYYRSSSLNEYDSSKGWNLYFNSSDIYMDDYGDRKYGFSVRAVQEPNTNTKFNPSETVSKVNNIESQIGDINTILESIIGITTLNFPILLLEGDNGEVGRQLYQYVITNAEDSSYTFKSNEDVSFSANGLTNKFGSFQVGETTIYQAMPAFGGSNFVMTETGYVTINWI